MNTFTEEKLRKEWISAMFDSSYKMDAEATLEWWLSQFQQYKASLLSQIEETSGWSTINGERYIKLEDIKKKII